MREANILLKERVKASLRAFDMSLKYLLLELNKFLVTLFIATTKVIYDVSLFGRLDNKNEIPKVYITFNKKRKGILETRTS